MSYFKLSFLVFMFYSISAKCIRNYDECRKEDYLYCATRPYYWPVEEIQQNCLTLFGRWCTTLNFMRSLYHARHRTNVTEVDMVNYYKFGRNLRDTCAAIEQHMSKI